MMKKHSDLAYAFLGYLKKNIRQYERTTRRIVNHKWRLVITEADYRMWAAEMKDGDMSWLATRLPAKLIVISDPMVEIEEGEPESITGRLVVVGPEHLERLGLE